MNLRVDADVPSADYAARSMEPTRLPIMSGPPGALSPLAGRRLLVTIDQPTRDGEARSLSGDLAFENALAFAAHLAALDIEVTLAAVGQLFRPEDLRQIARAPGVAALAGQAIARPQDDAARCAAEVQRAADSARADLVILHDPALGAVRRDRRPTVAICDDSLAMDWRYIHGDAAAPEALRAASALERLGLHAADRVIATSRALATDLVALHGLTVPPVIVPPVFRRPEPREKRASETGFALAGATRAEASLLVTLDHAAAQILGQVLLFDTGVDDAGHSTSFEQLHRLAPIGGGAAETLLQRAAAFYCASTGPAFEPLVWRAASAGCAMILPECKAHREFWQGAAHFVDPASEHEIAAALRRMLEDEDYRRRTAAAGLRRARALAMGPAVVTLHKVLADALNAAPLTAAL